MTTKSNTMTAMAHVARYAEDRVPSRSNWPPAWLAEAETPSITAESAKAAARKPPELDSSGQVDVASPIELPGRSCFASEAKAVGLLTPRPRPARVPGKCDRCGCTSFIDVAIHKGQSTRRDCARCRRFAGFPVWYGKPTDKFTVLDF
jgi:hypothetical protein